MIFSTIIKECQFRFSRSGGKGGQHVNKVSTKVELIFNILDSQGLSESEKHTILDKLKSKINKENELIIKCDTSRSQSKNREITVSKLKKELEQALIKEKRRIKTKTPKSVKEKILKKKKIRSQKKELRKKVQPE